MIEEGSSVPAKYVYLDVVGYTRDRSVNTQANIVDTLFEAAKLGFRISRIPEDRRILLPTGDGMCIVLVSTSLSEEPVQRQYEEPPDLHISLARQMLIRINVHNKNSVEPPKDLDFLRLEPRPQDQFQVRIGVNQSNSDMFYHDINGSWNVAGDGINIAQRAMSLADGNQIIATERVYDDLYNLEDFKGHFQGPYETYVKHGEWLSVYQYLSEGSPGLNNDPPSVFNNS